MHAKLYQHLARTIGAYHNCLKSDDLAHFDTWANRHRERIEAMAKEYLPSGSGIDSGSQIDLDRSTAERIIIKTAFHHMTEHGYYDGWTEHVVTVRPSLASGFTVSVSGRNRNAIKGYLGDVFYAALDGVRSDIPQRDAAE